MMCTNIVQVYKHTYSVETQYKDDYKFKKLYTVTQIT